MCAPLAPCHIAVAGAKAPNSRMLGALMAAAAEESPDFFAISGCDSMQAVAIVADAIEGNRRTHKRWTHVDLRGMELLDAEESWRGFDIPVLLLSSVPACQGE
eukprot:1053342-Prymnesium_polylepis.3